MTFKSYAIYVLLILVGVGVVVCVAWFLAANKPKGKLPYLVAGPAYFYIKRRDKKLSIREILLMLVVVIFMLLAPLLSYFLER